MRGYIRIASERVNHAVTHINQFRDQSRLFLNSVGYKPITIIESEGKQHRKVYWVQGDKPIPTELRFIVGDAIHDLRASLDNLAWGWAQQNIQLGARLTFFQFLSSPHILINPPPGLLSVVENLQMHKGRKEAQIHPTRTLESIWNIDKHNAPPLLRPTSRPVYENHPLIRSGVIQVERKSTGRTANEPSTIIAAFASADLQAIRDFEPEFLFDIAFDSRGPGKGFIVFDRLCDLHTFVQNEILAKLMPFLD